MTKIQTINIMRALRKILDRKFDMTLSTFNDLGNIFDFYLIGFGLLTITFCPDKLDYQTDYLEVTFKSRTKDFEELKECFEEIHVKIFGA